MIKRQMKCKSQNQSQSQSKNKNKNQNKNQNMNQIGCRILAILLSITLGITTLVSNPLIAYAVEKDATEKNDRENNKEDNKEDNKENSNNKEKNKDNAKEKKQENTDSKAEDGQSTEADSTIKEVINIASAQDLKIIATNSVNDTYTLHKKFVLQKDIDLSGSDYQPIAIFAGELDGNGHSIKGLRLNNFGANTGLIQYVEETGKVSNLTVEGDILETEKKENVGGIVGTNKGTIQNCTFQGKIIAQQCTGGIAGYNKETGKILSCNNEGILIGTKRTGGIAGKNEGTIENCANQGDVNATDQTVYDFGKENTTDFSMPDLTTDKDQIKKDLQDEKKINYIGGIAGVSSGTITGCENFATIGYEHMGYTIGGIVGYERGILTNSNNYGLIHGRKDIGGIAGILEPLVEVDYSEDTTNKIQDQMDTMLNLMDGLSDKTRAGGDTVTNNVDQIRNSVKDMRQIIRNHKEYYDKRVDVFDEGLDSRVSTIDQLIDELDFNIDDKKARDAINALRSDAEKLSGLLLKIQTLQAGISADQLYILYAGLGAASGPTVVSEPTALEVPRVIEETEEPLQNQGAVNGTVNDEATKDETIDGENGDSGTTGDGSGTNGSTGSETEDSGSTGSGTGNSGSTGSETENSGTTGEGSGTNGSVGTGTGNNGTTGGESGKDEATGNSGSTGSGSGDSGSTGSGSENSGSTGSGTEDNGSTGSGDSESASYSVQMNAGPTAVPPTTALLGDAKSKFAEMEKLLPQVEAVLKDMSAQGAVLGSTMNELNDEKTEFKEDLEDLDDHLDGLRYFLIDQRESLKKDLDKTDDEITAQSDKISAWMDQLSIDMKASKADIRAQMDLIQAQMHLLNDTVADGMEELRDDLNKDWDEEDPIEDISDTDDKTPSTGKVISCRNEGEIISDMNGGGIAGSMMVVSDAETDFALVENGKRSLNSDKKETAVIMDCKNHSDITVRNDYAGGIVGRSEVGAVIASENYGNIETTDGDYAGGIAGKSTYLIRNSYSLCDITGNDYCGGISGYGTDMKSNVAMAGIQSEGGGSRGTIAGDMDEDGEAAGNYFVEEGTGAIAGLSYEHQATPLKYEELIAMDQIPSEFYNFQVRFVVDNKVVKKISCKYGDKIPVEEYPEVPVKDGKVGFWENADLSNINRNKTVHGIYDTWTTTISSEEKIPVLLLSGDFYKDTVLQYTKEQSQKVEIPGYIVSDVYTFSIASQNQLPTGTMKVRVLADDYPKNAAIAVYQGNQYVPAATQRDGRYMVFVMNGAGKFAVIHQDHRMRTIGVIVILLVLIGGITVIKRKKKQLPPEEAVIENNADSM